MKDSSDEILFIRAFSGQLISLRKLDGVLFESLAYVLIITFYYKDKFRECKRRGFWREMKIRPVKRFTGMFSMLIYCLLFEEVLCQ